MATFIHDSFGEINRVANEGDEVVIASGTKSGIYRYFDLSTFPSFSYRFVGSKQLDLGTPFEDFDSTNDSITIDFWTNRGANDDGRAFAAVLPWIDSVMDFSLDSHTITNFGAIDAKLFPAYDPGNSSITLDSDWNLMKIDSALDSLSLFSPFTIEYMYNKFNTKNNRIFSINQRFNTLLSLDETGIVYNGTKYNLHVDSDLLSNTDSWTHNVLSYDGFEPRIYKDGNQLVSLTREDSTHFPVGVVEPGRLIDGRAPASFSIKTTIPESDKTLFFCGAEENRLIVRTIGLGTQIEISAGTNKQLSLIANVPDNINSHVISWDVDPTPGKIRLWIDSNYQGEASTTAYLNNDEWAATSFAAPVMTSFTESKTLITGGIPGSTEIATKDRTDGAQFYNRGPAFMDKPAFYANADGSYRYITEYPSVVGPFSASDLKGTIFEGSWGAAGSYSSYGAAHMSYHRSNDDIGSSVYGYPFSANTTDNQFQTPYWLPGHNGDLDLGKGGGRAYGNLRLSTTGAMATGTSGQGPQYSITGYPWWLARYYPYSVLKPGTSINWSEAERLEMGPFSNGASEHHGFGHQGYRWRTQPGPGSSYWFSGSWAQENRSTYSRISVPVLASYVKINSMTITPAGKKNYYFEVGEAGAARWDDYYLTNEKTYKYYLVKESLIDDPSVFYENVMPPMPNRSNQWVYYNTTQYAGSLTEPHGDGIYNEAVDDIDVSKYYTTITGHIEFIISEQDSHFHVFQNGVWVASYPFPSGTGPYKLIISSRANDTEEREGRYAKWRTRLLYDSYFEHGNRGNTWYANHQRRGAFGQQGLAQGAGGYASDYTYYQAILKFSKKSWRWDPETAYKTVPDLYRGVITADAGPKTGALGIDSDGSTWTGTLHSNLLYNKQLFVDYSDAELVVGNNLKSVKSLPHETGTQHAIDYVASTGGTIYNWSNPDGVGLSLQQQMQQVNDGDAIVIAPGTYTVNKDHGVSALSSVYGFHQRKNILITGSTNDPTDVRLNVGYFSELFSGRNAADAVPASGLYRELAYLTFKMNTWTLLYAPSNRVYGKAYRVNFELISTSRPVYAVQRTSDIQIKECIISNTSSWSNSIWSKYDARCLKWINCIFQKTGGQDPALQTDPRQANIFIGNNIMQVGDDIAYNKSKLRLGIPYFKVDTKNPITPVDKKRYIEDFMIHKTDKYGSITDSSQSGDLIVDNTNSEVFDRSLTVNGLKIVVAGAVGGQKSVPDEFARKSARVVELLMDKNATGINDSYRTNLIKTLSGDSGWHIGMPSAQRIAYGSGNSYDSNFLTDQGALSYSGYTNFLNTHMTNDMIWYKLNDDGYVSDSGDDNISEVMEHLFHTIHLFGIPGSVPGSVSALDWNAPANPSGYTSSELHLAMSEAINAVMYDPSTYAPNWNTDPADAAIAYKEYMYLLNWGMWDMSEFWEGNSLSPEWSDNMRTPIGIQANNPLGYTLFNTYFAPVLSKPSFTTLRTIFQDSDQGLSGYVSFPVNRTPSTDSDTILHVASNMTGGEQLAYNIDGTLIINNKSIKLNNAASGLGDWHHHSFNYRGSDNVLFSYFDGNKIDSMNIELDIEELSKSNLLLASTDDYDITSHSIVKSFSDLYIKEMRVSRKMRESGQDVFTLPVADLTTDSYTVILDATAAGNPLSVDVSPYTADAKSYRKVHSFNPGIESAEFDPLVTVGTIAKNEEPLTFNLRDGYRPIPHYVFKYESDGLLSNPKGYTSIIESDGSYIGELTGFAHDSLVTPNSDLAFDRSSHIIKLKRFDDLGDSINWSYIKSIPRNTIRLGRYDDDSNSIFYVKAYDISESNLHWNTDLAFVGKHVDSANRVPHIISGTRLNDSTSGDIELTFEYNGDMGVGVTYIADVQYIRIFDIDSGEAIGFDSSQVIFDPFQSYEGYL